MSSSNTFVKSLCDAVKVPLAGLDRLSTAMAYIVAMYDGASIPNYLNKEDYAFLDTPKGKYKKLIDKVGSVFPYVQYSDSWYSYRKEFSDESYLTVMVHLKDKNPEAYAVLKSFAEKDKFYGSGSFLSVCRIMEGNPDELARPRAVTQRADLYTIADFVLTKAESHTLDPFMKTLGSKDFGNALSLTLYWKFLDNEQVTDVLEKADRLVEESVKLSRIEKDDLHEYTTLYRYIYEGKEVNMEEGEMGQGPWAQVYYALRKMYAGDIDGALRHYKAAFRTFNEETSSYKNCVPDFIMSHFYIMCLKKADTPDSRKKVEQFLNKKLEEVYLHNWAELTARTVGATLHSSGPETHISVFIHRLYHRPMASIISKLTVLSLGKSSALLGTNNTDKLPVAAIVRHEMGAFVPIPDKDALQGLFGGPSLMGNMQFKQAWERQLEQAVDLLGKGAPAPKGIKTADSRIIYIIYPQSKTFEIHLQKAKKNGDWGTSTKMSARKFRDDRTLPKGPEDLALAAKLPDSRDSFFDYSILLKEMIGSDRVFALGKDPDGQEILLPVSIYEDKPTITVTKTKGDTPQYRISANTRTYDGEGGKTVFRTDDTHYSVVSTTPFQDKILRALIAIPGGIPLSAERYLRDILPRFAPYFDINSPLIDGGTTMIKVAGDSRLVLRITPTKENAFLLETLVKPLPSGKKIFLPGKGSKNVIDESSGKRYQINRDLDEERYNILMFHEFCEKSLDFDLQGAGEVDDTPFEMSPMDILDVLDYASRNTGSVAVEWKEGKRLVLRGTVEPKNVVIDIHSKERWFEMEGSVTLPDGNVLELAKLLQAISSGAEKDGYVRLGEDEYVKISDTLRKQLRKLEAMAQRGAKGKEKISVFQVGQLSELIRGGDDGMDVKVDRGIKSLMKKIEASSSLDVQVPSGLTATLRDYQVDGYEWMVRLDSWGGGACLADDMGLGKTIQTIAFLLHKKAGGAALVVTPASVLYNWQNELARFSPSLRVSILNTSADREALVRDAGPGDVILSTYGILVSEEKHLCEKKWNVVCLDEAHVIKNRDTKMSASAMKLSASSRIILTGTPVQNYLGELWNLFQFLNPGLLGTYEQFRTKFILPIENLSDKERQRQLRRMIQPFMLRRTKAEVVSELPDKTEITREVMLSAEETLCYEKIREEAKALLEGESKVSVMALSMITKLRQAACSMNLVEDNWPGHESKVTAFMDLVTEITSSGNRVLVFSQFTSFLSMCKAALDKASIPYFYLDGSTPIKKREEMVEAFQKGEMPLFLISLKAGGLGLNLTGANYVIHLDPWWNPAVEQQATDRAYRIGQRQNVTVYHLISSHTIEEKIVRLHKVKRDMADAILEGANVSHALTLEDLRELVDF